MALEYRTHVITDGAANPYPDGAAGYETQVRGILDTINATKTGHSVLGFFALRSHRVRIIPPDDLQTPADPNAFTGADDNQAATRAGFEQRSGRDGHVIAGRPRGTGLGSDSHIEFHPVHWSGPGLGFITPGQVLLHELFHAVRQVFGARRSTPLGGGFDTVEELYSVFVENMFMAELGLPLIFNHGGRTPASPDHSMRLHPEFHAAMRDISAMMPFIVHTLAKVPGPYNPFRDWLEFSASA